MPAIARTATAAMIALAATTLLSGCVRTAASIVTAPVRVVSKATDWATTSQSEADRNRGREIRRREERLGSLERRLRRHQEQCADGDRDACEQARSEQREIEELAPTVPVERD